MNKIEIKDFKKFLNERNVLLMFSTYYRQHHLTVNPPTLDEYLEIIDVQSKTNNHGLPKNTCSLSLKGGNRLTLNMEHSKMVAKKLSTHMLLTRSRQSTDVVLMFNRTKGIEVKSRAGSSSLQFNNADLACHLIELLELDIKKEYFLLDIELLSETKDYLLFMIKNKEEK